MSDRLAPIKKPIVINKTDPPESGKVLHQCFFLPSDIEGVYNLYKQNGKIVAAGLVSGQDFNFTVDGHHFDISDFTIDNENGRGNWSDGFEQDDGSFQATAGV